MQEGIKVLLGKSVREGKKIYWEPKREKNPHLVVVGTSGSGKTETLRSIILELKRQNVPSIIIDFHAEFRDVADQVINLRDLTINPLEIELGRRPQDVVYEVANIMKKIFSLGDQQEALLRQAIRRCYEDNRINILNPVYSNMKAPPFMDIKDKINEIYDESDSISRNTLFSLTNRIEALFEVDIFFKENTIIPFDTIIRKTTSIELKDFPTEDIKSVIAEFFLNKLIYYLYKAGKSDSMRLHCVIDEAHRLTYEGSPLDRLLRESRKYGTGIILSSQRPSDFSETILANSGGIISLQCSLEKDAKFVARQMNLDFIDVKNLTDVGSGFVKFSSDNVSRKIKIQHINERLTEEEKSEIERKLRQFERLVIKVEEKKKRKVKPKKRRKLRPAKKILKSKKSKKEKTKRLTICRNCLYGNEKDALYCTECGARL
ncbi:MAG: ATP-binding protein [Candidatus Aenigmarchaeota archaeon]|nr:ATP-binding protein [Candidatus Aenigmarchaeota archaeon]